MIPKWLAIVFLIGLGIITITSYFPTVLGIVNIFAFGMGAIIGYGLVVLGFGFLIGYLIYRNIKVLKTKKK